ncbi:MAG: site-2 protease family protein [Chloroflexi bacterium]|nr:site-2 protease family protein [Chloroflexota bacterium]
MSGLPVARLFGFEIRIHLSWAIILAVIAVTVVSQVGSADPTVPLAARWLIGGLVAAAFLASALVHELGHALAARRSGIGGGTITVYFFGGSAMPDIDAARPRDEIVTAAAGPLVSLGVGAVLLGVAGIGALVGSGPVLAVGQIALVVGVLNLVLGGLNLLPAFPLDGGRIVRGIFWARTGDPFRATRLAARSGRFVGWGLAGIGLIVILALDTIDGLMVALCGWFITSAARQVDRRALLDELLAGVPVREVMDAEVQGVPPGLTIDTFAGQMLDGSASPSQPVMRGRELLGMLGAIQLRRIRRDRWPETRAEDLMVATGSLPVVGLETPIRQVFDDLRRADVDGLPVIGADGLAGIVTRRAIVDKLKAQADLRGVTLS